MSDVETIPPMTDPLSVHWEQPSLDSLVLTPERAHMTIETFERLQNYSGTVPSGVYDGKMWSANLREGHKGIKERWLRWYGPSTNGDSGMCKVYQRRVYIVSPAEFDALKAAERARSEEAVAALAVRQLRVIERDGFRLVIKQREGSYAGTHDVTMERLEYAAAGEPRWTYVTSWYVGQFEQRERAIAGNEQVVLALRLLICNDPIFKKP